MFIQKNLHKKSPICINYANVHSYITAKKNCQLKKALHTADIVYSDGWGIVLAAKLFGLPTPTRLTAYDFFPQFLQKADNQRTSLYLLGGSKETIKKTAIMIKKQYPHIQIQGFHNGYIQTKQEELRIIREINQKKVNILLVGMGTPMQEIWTYKNKHTLNVKVIWCVGGLFDYLSGDMKHCPKWIGNIGFQWLWRLVHEPRRLWKRYLLELPQFFIYIMKAKFLYPNI
jgi:N-acetylglucosaminyldiphosphoundecaprenol N-acetyl-beta-D-mannosaminyltransferase